MEELLLPGIDYRHVVLTVPEQLRHYFEECPQLLGEMVKAGVRTLTAVMNRAAGCQLRIGVVAVIQTAGRASNYNPHLRVLSVMRRAKEGALCYGLPRLTNQA
jgi:hypothetical protein